MNTELRMAVRTPKSGSHTVSTGRPGTGKSQVVAKLVLNAARRGMTAWCVSPRWIRLGATSGKKVVRETLVWEAAVSAFAPLGTTT